MFKEQLKNNLCNYNYCGLIGSINSAVDAYSELCSYYILDYESEDDYLIYYFTVREYITQELYCEDFIYIFLREQYIFSNYEDIHIFLELFYEYKLYMYFTYSEILNLFFYDDDDDFNKLLDDMDSYIFYPLYALSDIGNIINFLKLHHHTIEKNIYLLKGV